MQSLRTAMAGVFAFALVLMASTAWADEDNIFDRPDLMDIAEQGDLYDGQIGNWQGFADDANADNQMAVDSSVAYGGYSTVLGGWDADGGVYRNTWTQAPTGYIYSTWTWLTGYPFYGNGNKYYYTWYAEGEYSLTYTTTWWDYDYDSDFTFAEVRWVLAQPDKVLRNHKMKKIRQKDYVGFVAVLDDHVGESERVGMEPGDVFNPLEASEISELFYYGSIAGCRGKVKVKDTTPDPVRANADAENCGDEAKWKIRCNQDLRTILGQLRTAARPARFGQPPATMTEATVERFLTLLGADGTETMIRGRDTGHTCDPDDDEGGPFDVFWDFVAADDDD